MQFSRRYIIFSLLFGLILLPIPLIRDFHIESALIAALVGCFWAGWSGCAKGDFKSDWRRITTILGALLIAGAPLFIYALITGCLSLHGIGYWILYPGPSVLFGYSLGRLLRLLQISYRRLITVLILLFIAIGVLLIEFFNLPQVYFFNHVWGGWPGPIYDETVIVTWSLVLYRGLTLAWVAILWNGPHFSVSTRAKTAVVGAAVLLLVGYVNLAEMGIITPRSYLKQQLSGEKETEHFRLYYDEEAYSEAKISFIAQKHEFYYDQITEELDLESVPQEKIESYLYAHPWQKKALVGAKFTSYVPVWLNQDQLHIGRQQISGSLKHELVHVLAKRFGNDLLNASWSIGLVEGLAVALAPNESSVSTINQIVAAEKPYPDAAEMQSALSPIGFYGGSSAVSYTESGSFVQYLLNTYSIDNIKRAYRTGDIASAYNSSFNRLVNGWHQVLDTVRVDSVDEATAERIYAIPSLFEKKCPHVPSNLARYIDQYQLAMTTGDTLRAIRFLDEAVRELPDALPLKSQWAYLNLKMDRYKNVQQTTDISDTLSGLLLLYADAFAIDGKMDQANRYVLAAKENLKPSSTEGLQKALQLRENATQWRFYRSIIYKGERVSDSTFTTLFHRTQVRALEQALEAEQWFLVERYASLFESATLDPEYFDTYLRLVEWLALQERMNLAESWLLRLNDLPLRVKQQNQLAQIERWKAWLNERDKLL